MGFWNVFLSILVVVESSKISFIEGVWGNKWLREEHLGFREEFEIFKEENLWLREISLRYCERLIRAQ